RRRHSRIVMRTAPRRSPLPYANQARYDFAEPSRPRRARCHMPTDRRVLWVVATFVFASLVGVIRFSRAQAADNQRLRVLLIAFDDLRPELGCYGNKLIDTPNFDALAKAGVRFERAYCQFPLCNPSRTSLLTGRQPNTTGVVDNRAYFRDAHPDFVTLPQHFKRAGYTTARTGKIFHGGIDDTE